MEDVKSDDAARNRPGPGEPIKEASTATSVEDSELVYYHTCFQRDKVRRRYFCYYHGRRIIVERGAIIEEFDERASKVRVVMDGQGWMDMVEDHRPVVEDIVWEFYTNIHQRRSNSFHTWLRGMVKEVTPTLINTITGVPLVRDPTYPWPVDHLLLLMLIW
jgi:hypothetical protein